MPRRAPGVEFTKHKIGLQRTVVGRYSRNRKQGLQQLTWVIPMCGPPAPVAYDFEICFLSKDFSPYLELSGNVWIAVRLPAKAGYQKTQTGVMPKHACSCIGKVFAAEHLVKAPQPARFGEMRLLGQRYARQVVKIRREPATVLRNQFRNEFTRRIRRCSDQIFPGGGRGRSARHNHSSRSNANVAAVEVQNFGLRDPPFLRVHMAPSS